MRFRVLGAKFMTSLTGRTDDVRSEGESSTPASGVGRQMAKSTGWTVGARIAVQAIGVVSTMILARLLVPADFGLVALATTTSTALQTLSEFSFDVVLIQNQRADRADYDTAWTLSVLRNLFLAFCLALFAKTISGFFGDPRLEPIIYILAGLLVLSGFQNIGIVDFRKDLAFHKDLQFMVLAKIAGFVVTVPLAFLWRDYWALVVGIVAGSLARFGLSFAMHPYRPRFSIARWRHIMHFSKWLLLNNICGFVFSRSDTIMLGRFAGVQAVGVYNIASEVAGMVTANLLAPLRRAIFPGYAKVAEDPESLRKAYIDVLALVLLAGTPVVLGIGLVAEPLVRLMLGSHWLASIPLIEVFSLNGFLALLTAGASPIFLATGHPRYVMLVQGSSSIFLLPALFVGVWYGGALGAAWAMLATGCVAVSMDLPLILRLLKLPIGRVLAASWRPVIAAIVLAAVVKAIEWHWGPLQSSLASAKLLAVAVPVGALCYVLVALALWLMSGRPDGAERNTITAFLWLCRKAIKRP